MACSDNNKNENKRWVQIYFTSIRLDYDIDI